MLILITDCVLKMRAFVWLLSMLQNNLALLGEVPDESVFGGPTVRSQTLPSNSKTAVS